MRKWLTRNNFFLVVIIAVLSIASYKYLNVAELTKAKASIAMSKPESEPKPEVGISKGIEKSIEKSITKPIEASEEKIEKVEKVEAPKPKIEKPKPIIKPKRYVEIQKKPLVIADSTMIDTMEFVENQVIEEIITYKGMATYYHKKFEGRRTANGEIFDNNKYTAAIRMNEIWFPFGTLVEVVNKRNGKKVIVKINDRMSDNTSAIIDLSQLAAKEIGLIRAGRTNVSIRVIDEYEME